VGLLLRANSGAGKAYAEMIGDPRYLAPPAAESFCGALK
jgi:hypothetical protein